MNLKFPNIKARFTSLCIPLCVSLSRSMKRVPLKKKKINGSYVSHVRVYDIQRVENYMKNEKDAFTCTNITGTVSCSSVSSLTAPPLP